MTVELGLRPLPNMSSSRLIAVAENIWTLEANSLIYYRPPAQLRYPYTNRTVVIRLQDESLFIYSPIALTSKLQAEIDKLGRVQYLVSPNAIHHLYMGDWHQAYPEAKLYASPGLASKRRDLAFEKTLSTDVPEPGWNGQIEQQVFRSWNGWFDELVFFHCESRTVIFADMIMDFDPEIFSGIARVTTQWNQMYRHTPRGIQLVNSLGRQSLRSVLDNIRAWEPEHLIVAHSPWQCVDGAQQVSDFLESAFDWLKPQSAPIEVSSGVMQLLLLLFVILPLHILLVLTADILYPRLFKGMANQ